MRTTTALAAAAITLLALTGCSSDTGDSKASPRPTSAPPSSTATAKPSPTPDAPLAFGAAITVRNKQAGTVATTTVIGYEQGTIHPHTSADEEFGTKGYVWAAIELKLCSKQGTIAASRYPWALAYADGTRIEPSGVTYGDFPKPEYPYDAKVKAGDCIRGKTVFAVPGKQRPERVLYTTELFDTPPEWAVPAA